MPSGASIPATTNSQDGGIGRSELPRLTEARTLTDICGASKVDASDVMMIDDDFDVDADDPVDRFPDGEFDE